MQVNELRVPVFFLLDVLHEIKNAPVAAGASKNKLKKTFLSSHILRCGFNGVFAAFEQAAQGFV